ncbi:DEAD/DEAH box helicase [Mycoplasma bradburyae]|uniref:DEAD/DEAH box helicase n=1 Tax=Mycoplasma bradburyae TaxID=2963128 RepID=UPI002341B457|nr:DEAD/DEAH box helicase [Mycoplasma bradburyae]MDC4183989.1 DEAD/DEAH box helicase [Mycoplasma bradburyae]
MINKILEYYFQDSELVRGKNLVNRKTVKLTYHQENRLLLLSAIIRDEQKEVNTKVTVDGVNEKLLDITCDCKSRLKYCRYIAATIYSAYIKLKKISDKQQKESKKQDILSNSNKIRETKLKVKDSISFSIESIKKSFNTTKLSIFLNVDEYKFKLVNENYFLLKQNWMNGEEISFYVCYENAKTPAKLLKISIDSNSFKYQDLYMFWYLVYLCNTNNVNDETFLREGSYLHSDFKISNPGLYALNDVKNFKDFLDQYDQSYQQEELSEDLINEINSCFNECSFIVSSKKNPNRIVLITDKGDVYKFNIETFVDKKWVPYLSHYLSKDNRLFVNPFNEILNQNQINHEVLNKVSITSKEFLDLYIYLSKLGFEDIYIDDSKKVIKLIDYLPKAGLVIGFDDSKSCVISNLIFNYKRSNENNIVYYDNKETLRNQRLHLYEENTYDFFFKKVINKKLSSKLKKNLLDAKDLEELKQLADSFIGNEQFHIKLLDAYTKELKLKFNIKNFKKIETHNDLIKITLDDFGYDFDFIKEIVSYHLLSKEVFITSNGFYYLKDPDNQEFLEFWSKFDFYGIKKVNSKTLIFNRYRLLDLYNAFKNYNNHFKKIAVDEIVELIDALFNNSFKNELKIDAPFDRLLWPYQKEGNKWLRTMQKFGFGAIMADDMGLGKTIQTISVIAQYYKEHPQEIKQSLIVAPSSLLLNWASEFKKFAPDLKVAAIKGNVDSRKAVISSRSHVVEITTYAAFRRDKLLHAKKDYAYIVLDEAQSIKNASSILSKEIKSLKAAHKVALTGTVIENRLSELWSIFDFVLPGFFGSISDFNFNYTSSIERDEKMNEEAIQRLKKKISPFILRRTKEKVLKDLPPKTQSDLLVALSLDHVAFYREREKEVKDEILKIIQSKDKSKKGLGIMLAKLLNELRQICCSPKLIDSKFNGENVKFTAAIDIINNAMKSNKKVLLFSQYLGVIDLFKKDLEEKGIKYFILTGETPKEVRLEYVNEFNNLKEPAVFIASLKAGGVGLNLTGAEIVIHYDLWWNLALQNQATDRAHRIGQKNHVQVYRIIAADTIEERIVAIQERKKELASKLIQETDNSLSWLNVKDILSLFE